MHKLDASTAAKLDAAGQTEGSTGAATRTAVWQPERLGSAAVWPITVPCKQQQSST